VVTRSEAEQRRQARLAIAERRLRAVLRSNVVATARTLEQKISDAGPGAQCVDPHILTIARKRLMEQGVITRRMDGSSSAPWFHLTAATAVDIAAKLALVKPIHLSQATACSSERSRISLFARPSSRSIPNLALPKSDFAGPAS
jgi:hypothetical protein